MDKVLIGRNIESLCRICLQELSGNVEKPISFDSFLSSFGTVTHSDAFTKCTGYFILAHEPQLLCLNCSNLLNFAYELKEKAENAQGILDELVPRIDVALLKVELEDTEEFEDTAIDIEDTGQDVDDQSDNEEDDVKEFKPRSWRVYDPDPDFEIHDKDSFKCQYCDNSYKSRSGFDYHLKTVHTEEQPFQCQYCKKRFVYEMKLDAHQSFCSKRPKVPGNSKSKQKFVCPVCGILASKEHVKSHSKSTEKEAAPSQSYICDLCGVVTGTRGSMGSHMRYQHLHLPAKCRKCPGVFNNPSSLARHMRRAHMGNPDFRCRICDFSCLRESELRRHRIIHTGIKIYKCHVCGAEFNKNYKLQIHLASHSDARPFTCEICGSAFKTKKGLGAHKKTHKAYDYECPVCQRAYLTNQLMRHHAEKNHPEYQLPPPGTVFSKSWRQKRAEQQAKDEAMEKGLKEEDVVVQELPPSIQQPYFKYNF